MSSVSAGMPAIAESVSAYYKTSGTDRKTKSEEQKDTMAVIKKTDETKDSAPKTRVSGRTIGNPELSEGAAKYYEELKKKYGNMDFILVSRDQKEYAKARASSYSNPNRMVVLIDEDKIERMAEDENYRKQYEGIISQGANGLSQLKSRLDSMGIGVKNYGMQINDNGASSFFATMDKSFKEQGKLAEKRLANKKAAKKAEEKKAQKKADEKKLQDKLEKSRAEQKDMEKSREKDIGEDEITFTANSIDELMKKIEDMDYLFENGKVVSEREKQLGQRFDFAI